MSALPIIIGLGVILLVLFIAFRSRGQSRDGSGNTRTDAADTTMIVSPFIVDTSSPDDDRLGDGDGGGATGDWGSDGGGSDGGGSDGGGGGGGGD
jgi:hypothetical protein